MGADRLHVLAVPSGQAAPREKVFRRGQLVSAAFYSLGHGGNDAQKTMGIIFVLLIAASQGGKGSDRVPTEVVLSCYLAMGLGTMLGGWRIVKTMGQKIITCGRWTASVPRPGPP